MGRFKRDVTKLDCSHYNDVLDIQKQLQTMKTDLTGIITSGGPEALISLISSKKTWVDQQISFYDSKIAHLSKICAKPTTAQSGNEPTTGKPTMMATTAAATTAAAVTTSAATTAAATTANNGK